MRVTPKRIVAELAGNATFQNENRNRLSLDHSPDASEGEDGRLDALRRAFLAVGLTVHRMALDELAVTGPQFARSLPDTRTGWLLLRQLRGGAA